MRVERIIGGLALLVACAVALGVAPEVALAEEVSYVDANDQAATVDATEVAQEGWRWGNGVTWYVAKGTVEIDGRVTVSGDVNLILADDAQLTVKGGIEVSGDNSLTVYAQSTGDDMGKLLADASEEYGCAGIGGGYFGSGLNITVSGGAVTATGGKFGAGIGGGYSGSGSDITISGGAVTATGASGGAGIGGGIFETGSNIKITGGALADRDAVTASAADASSLGMVYGVKPAEDYAVVANANEGEDDYPVRVYPADDASFGADVLQSPIKKEYDGDPVTVDAAAFDPKRGEASAVDDLVIEFAVHTGSTHGDSDWTSGAPADAGSYDLRLTIPGKLVYDTWWRSTSITYLGTPNTNDAPVKISPASVLYAVPSDVILEAAVGDVLADVASPQKLDVLLGAPTFGTEKNEVPGTWSWADDSVTLDEAGEHAFKAVFTIDEASGVGNFDFSEVEGWDAGSASFSVDVTVSVAGSAVDPDPDPDPAPPYVPPARPTYPPEVPEADGGTVEVSPSRPHRGDEVTVSPKPDEGQEVREVAVADEDGEPVTVTDNGDGTWSFEQPAGKVTVTVTFGCDGGGLCPGRAFADVDPSALDAFADAGGVSGWARAAVAWAVQSGVLSGAELADDSRELQAGREVSRAEMSAMLMNAVRAGALPLG